MPVYSSINPGLKRSLLGQRRIRRRRRRNQPPRAKSNLPIRRPNPPTGTGRLIPPENLVTPLDRMGIPPEAEPPQPPPEPTHDLFDAPLEPGPLRSTENMPLARTPSRPLQTGLS